MKALSELVKYNSLTGEFTWKKNGLKAGGVDKQSGYYQFVRPSGKIYGHRLAFVCMGVPAPEFVDHRDQDRSNNKWENINPTSWVDNNRNKKTNSNNTSGHIGVSMDKRNGKWCAYIMVDYKKISLGTFDEKSDAILARQKADIKYGFSQNHGGCYEEDSIHH